MSGSNGHTPAGELDLGAERETRARPCTKRTWCILSTHEGVCVEIPGSRPGATDFGPKAKP